MSVQGLVFLTSLSKSICSFVHKFYSLPANAVGQCLWKVYQVFMSLFRPSSEEGSLFPVRDNKTLKTPLRSCHGCLSLICSDVTVLIPCAMKLHFTICILRVTELTTLLWFWLVLMLKFFMKKMKLVSTRAENALFFCKINPPLFFYKYTQLPIGVSLNFH